MGWFAECRSKQAEAAGEAWVRLGGPYTTQERAKAQCKATLLSSSDGQQLVFRTVADDERGTVYQESHPPHAWRLKWVNAPW